MVSWVNKWLALWVRCHPSEAAITAAAFFGKTCPVFPWNTTWRGSKTPSVAALPSTVNWHLSSFPKLSTYFAPLISYVCSEKGFKCTPVWLELTTRQSRTKCIEQSAATRNAISSPWTTQSSGSFLAALIIRHQVQPKCLWAKVLANVLEMLNLTGWPSLSLPTTLSNSSGAPIAITPWIVVLMIELSICWPARHMPLRQSTIWLAISGWSLRMPLGFSVLWRTCATFFVAIRPIFSHISSLRSQCLVPWSFAYQPFMVLIVSVSNGLPILPGFLMCCKWLRASVRDRGCNATAWAMRGHRSGLPHLK